MTMSNAAIAHNATMTARLPPMPFTAMLRIVALVATALLAACAGSPPAAVEVRDGATFIVVRHAEKTSDTERDPDLSDTGLARARALAELLADAELAAILTTDYRRTRQTVQPTAEARHITPETYDAKLPAAEFAARLRADHPRGTVLVAGHSNTAPDIVAALCACDVEPMPETEYDRLSTVRIAPDGRAILEVTRYGATTDTP